MDSLYFIIAAVVVALIAIKVWLYRFIRIKIDESCIVETIKKSGGELDFDALMQKLELSEQRIAQVAGRSEELVLSELGKKVTLAAEVKATK